MPLWFTWRGANKSRLSSLWIGGASPSTEPAADGHFALSPNCSILGRGNSIQQRISMALLRSCLIAAVVVVVALISVSGAQQNSAAASKYEQALDVTSMDRSVDPCVNFFQYS